MFVVRIVWLRTKADRSQWSEAVVLKFRQSHMGAGDIANQQTVLAQT
jgi:hypothetical protein